MEIVNVAYLGSNGQYQTYEQSDLSLINNSIITARFGGFDDYIEYYIKDVTGNILSSNYNATQYNIGSVVDPITGTTTQLQLDPETDCKNAGYNRGSINVKYNFFTRQLASAPSQTFWIKEISTSRTEIKVARQDLSNSALQTAFTAFSNTLAADAYYPDFLLNFGLDRQIIGVNAVYVEEGQDAYIIFKLYEPLPSDFALRSTFWVVTTAADPAEFNVNIQAEPETIQTSTPLRGPNYKINVQDTIGQTTPYYSYQSLFNTAISSSYQQLQSMMDEKGIQINVDYSDLSNFVHFSSATERINNFVYKLQLIESASAGLSAANTVSAQLALQNSIDSIITKFDGYEYYLYYTSASTAWPKSNSTQPYTLYSVSSSEASNWLGTSTTVPTPTTMSMYYSASSYDDTNSDLLRYSMPAYLRDDSGNEPYMIFLDMIGQHFDNIWIYLKDVSNRFSAENNPFVGISMDQVADALRGLGTKLYTNTSISDNIYYSLFGINPDGSLLPPTGSEVIDTYVTSSIQTLPGTQITNEIYKRLYHNLSYLLKTRGTERGVRALITTYGIPNDILTVHEFGGYDINLVTGIQEIANEKIITGSGLQQINTSLLSPYATLQYYDNNLMKSSIDLEIGFSPADSINADITSSYITSSTQPGYFDIMQYIGDPNLQYSSSYTPLVDLSNDYFATYYTSRYNVWDFIRLIKYYNNSLFKMLRDWVPARSSAATGIIIKSHILERNKYARHEPTYITSSYDGLYLLGYVSGSSGGCVSGSTAYTMAIPVQYNGTASAALSQSLGTIYMPSTDGVQAYNGEFGGSYIQMDVSPFDQTERSTYVYPRTSSIAGPPNVMFLTYSISPLFENVTDQVTSQRFLDLDYNGSQILPTNYGLITKSIQDTILYGNVYQSEQPYSQYARLQDYNYSYRGSINARYSGSTLSGRIYNRYTGGDISYGYDPVINYHTNKLGYFTQIQSSSYLTGKVNATLAYMADVSGGLFELNQNNKHWEDIQNTFKAGTTLTIKQFDNKKYSNQVATDGVKQIYSSGYNYTPQLYFSASDNPIYFEYGSAADSEYFIARNIGPNAFISGAAGPSYPASSGSKSIVLPSPYGTARGRYIVNLFNQVDVGSGVYTPGSIGASFGTYTPTQNGTKTFTTQATINIQVQSPDVTVIAGTELWVNGAFRQNFPSSSFRSSAFRINPTVLAGVLPTDYTIGNGLIGPISPQIFGPFVVSWGVARGGPTSWIRIQEIDLIYQGQRIQYDCIVQRSSDLNSYPILFPIWNEYLPSISVLSYFTPGSSGQLLSGDIQLPGSTVPTQLNTGDTVQFKHWIASTDQNYTASISYGDQSLLTVGSTSNGAYAQATTASADFLQDLVNTTSNRGYMLLNSSVSQYTDWIFTPYFESGSRIYSSSLYTTYGDINASFNPEAGDIVTLIDNTGLKQELTVLDSYLQGTQLRVDVTPSIVSNWVDDATLVQKILFLKRYKDEQNVIVQYTKPPGATSYGFLIPDKTNPEVLAKINTLQSAVQSQVLNNQGGGV